MRYLRGCAGCCCCSAPLQACFWGWNQLWWSSQWCKSCPSQEAPLIMGQTGTPAEGRVAEENLGRSVLLACCPNALLLAKSARWGVKDRLSPSSHLAKGLCRPSQHTAPAAAHKWARGMKFIFLQRAQGFCTADSCKCSSFYHLPKWSQPGLRSCQQQPGPCGLWVMPWVVNITPSRKLCWVGQGQAEMPSVHSLEYWDFSLGHFSSCERLRLEPFVCS